MFLESNSSNFSFAERIALDCAEYVCDKVAASTIKDLQRMKDELQSGDDSGLTNIWQEICVQLQAEFSVYWNLYDELVDSIINRKVNDLPLFCLAAMQYSDGLYEYDGDFSKDCDNETALRLIKNRVYEFAVNNTEKKVAEYLDKQTKTDW